MINKCIIIFVITLISACSTHRFSREVLDQCERQVKESPESFPIDEFAVEAAGLRADQLLDLFSQKNIKAIDVRIKERKNGRFYVAYGVGDNTSWIAPNPGKYKYFRIGISKDGDQNCLPTEALASDYKTRIRRPPFLVDTCLSVERIEESTARYEIYYKQKDWWRFNEFSHWALRDRLLNKDLVEISTEEEIDAPRGGYDCRTPYSMVMYKIDGRRVSKQSDQVVTQAEVLASIRPGQIDFNSLPKVEASIDRAFYERKYVEAFFHTINYDEGWRSAIEEAKENKYGYYYNNILDWKNRTLTKLKIEINRLPTDERTYITKTSASDGGYFIMVECKKNSDGLCLLRYDNRGNYQWGVDVTYSAQGEKICGIGPWIARVYDDKILLEELCGKQYGKIEKETGRYLDGGSRIAISRQDIERKIALQQSNKAL